MKYATIKIEKQKHIALVQLNRPDVMNALNQELIEDFYNCFHKLEQDQEIRVIILSGAGRAFCAGGDVSFLEEINSKSQMQIQQFLEHLFHKLTILKRIEKPVIAALNGYVLGAGLGLALLCDLRVAAETTIFGAEFPRMGIVPELGITHTLPAMAGLAKAMELVVTARRFNTAEAERIGILNKIVPDEKLMEETVNFTKPITDLPPLALGLSKMALQKGLFSSLESSLQIEAKLNALCYHTQDHKEAIASFFEKRKPVFLGR